MADSPSRGGWLKSLRPRGGAKKSAPAGPSGEGALDLTDGADGSPGSSSSPSKSPDVAGVAGSQPPTASAGPAWRDVPGRPRCGFTTAALGGLQLLEGDGTSFSLRIGPDYKKHGKKEPSLTHIYTPLSIDVFKRDSIAFHVSSRLSLPPPPDGYETPNASGLPRRLVINVVIPREAPPLMGGGTDGACYQIVVVFGATAEALAAWRASGSEAVQLFQRFVANAPEGVTPSSGDVDVKERLKLLPRIDNIASLGIPGWIAGYNGKPALITKSGSLYRGDDYLEASVNTFRFAFLTKKGINYLLPRLSDFHLHAAFTLEGRDNNELPERTLCAARLRGLDFRAIPDGDQLPEPSGPSEAALS